MGLERCHKMLSDAAVAPGVGTFEPLEAGETAALLDLARVAAHAVERKAASLDCFSVRRALAETGASDRLVRSGTSSRASRQHRTEPRLPHDPLAARSSVARLGPSLPVWFADRVFRANVDVVRRWGRESLERVLGGPVVDEAGGHHAVT